MFHFTVQLLYSPVLVMRVTTACDVIHKNAVSRERRKPLPDNKDFTFNADLSTQQ
jgi:hypothetical protein